MPDGTVNERLRDELIHRAVRTAQFSNATARKMIALLNRVDAKLADRIASAVARLGEDSFTAAHMDSVLKSVRALNAEIFSKLSDELIADLKGFAGNEIAYQTGLFNSIIPAPILSQVALSSVSVRQVWAAAASRPFQGRLLKEWLRDVEATRAARIRDTIRIGIVEGRTTDQIVRDIVGRKAQNYADGIINRSRHDVESVVRTAISHTQATARRAFYAENSDLIKGEVWTSTLDTKTTPICIERDGLKYDLEGKPIGHSVPYLSGPGKSHWNCRSVGVPITKSWRELGLDIDEIDPGTRSSMDGYVPAETTYSEWFKKQSAARQNEVLGPTRGALYRKGGYPISKFINDKGRLIPLDEL